MGACAMAKLGCLLMILAMVALFAIVVIPVLPFLDDNAEIDTMLQALLCEPGERVIRQQYSRTDSDGTSYSMDVFCMGRDEVRRDVTGRWVLIGVVGFVGPFLLGLAGLILGVNRFSNRARWRAEFANSTDTLPPSVTITTSRAAPDDDGEDKSLSERLEELERARSLGLITEAEYERMRKAVLDEGV